MIYQVITNLGQDEVEFLYDSWERFKLLLKKCQSHGLDIMARVLIFTHDSRVVWSLMSQLSTGGIVKTKSEIEVKELIENRVDNEYCILVYRG